MTFDLKSCRKLSEKNRGKYFKLLKYQGQGNKKRWLYMWKKQTKNNLSLFTILTGKSISEKYCSLIKNDGGGRMSEITFCKRTLT